jgi:iron complex transport system permease protein
MMSVDFRAGGFASVSHIRIIPAAALIGVSLLALLLMSNELDVLALGDDTAKSLGLPVKQMRILFLALAALLAGAAVSFAGLLGFIGLIVPHALRKLAGNDSRLLLPLCALGGAAFVTLCDTFARLAFAPYEVPVGIIMSVIGGPVFLALLLKKIGGHGHA